MKNRIVAIDLERQLSQIPSIPGTARRWHYTIWEGRMERILKSRVIEVAKHFPPDVALAVWFSTNPLWEVTADKNGTRSMQDNHRTGLGLYRIEVAPTVAPYGWSVFKAVSGISQEDARIMENGANPQDWYVSFAPVKQCHWLAIEQWTGNRWTRFDGKRQEG